MKNDHLNKFIQDFNKLNQYLDGNASEKEKINHVQTELFNNLNLLKNFYNTKEKTLDVASLINHLFNESESIDNYAELLKISHQILAKISLIDKAGKELKYILNLQIIISNHLLEMTILSDKIKNGEALLQNPDVHINSLFNDDNNSDIVKIFNNLKNTFRDAKKNLDPAELNLKSIKDVKATYPHSLTTALNAKIDTITQSINHSLEEQLNAVASSNDKNNQNLKFLESIIMQIKQWFKLDVFNQTRKKIINVNQSMNNHSVLAEQSKKILNSINCKFKLFKSDKSEKEASLKKNISSQLSIHPLVDLNRKIFGKTK